MSGYAEFQKEIEQQRKKKLEDIVTVTKKVSPIPYAKLVHLLYIELGLGYLQNKSRGVYDKELDSLIAVGKLKLKMDNSGLLIVFYEEV